MPVPSSDVAYYDPESMIDVPLSQLPSREKGDDLFALEVQGDSMIDAMVNDGDIVIMKPAREARNGEMVAIWLRERNETTLVFLPGKWPRASATRQSDDEPDFRRRSRTRRNPGKSGDGDPPGGTPTRLNRPINCLLLLLLPKYNKPPCSPPPIVR